MYIVEYALIHKHFLAVDTLLSFKYSLDNPYE